MKLLCLFLLKFLFDLVNVENTNVYHTELTVEEQRTLNNNDSTDEVNQNSVEQVGELVNDMVSTLMDQRGREAVGLRRESYNVHRSRSPSNRIRSTSSHRRCRRRRQRGATTHESPTERQPRAHDERDREVTYELITKKTVPCEMSRTWRLVPIYKKTGCVRSCKTRGLEKGMEYIETFVHDGDFGNSDEKLSGFVDRTDM
ncbi:uncharacterized protein [Rhodnius prolixus]|uniref:uncharacterized protein n=1 Tax=Rhodnius prolixus TaxID=13249 RepID=UPI003D18798D